ncbi:neuronal acetylcholine receptor subunit alpha-9-like [Clytia hemisphaerica]
MDLFRDLFLTNEGYTSKARPVLDKSKPVIVKMNIALAQVVELNDRDQSLTTNIWIRQFWKNEFLTWNPSDYANITELTITKNWIWTPDLVLYNSVEDNWNGQLDQYKTRIIIRYDGLHTWYIPAIITAGCSIDIRFFPFDYQKCPLQFGSWSYSSPELDLELTRNDIDLSFYQESSQFWLIRTEAVRNSVKYSCCPHPLTDITFTIVLKRKAGFHMFNVIVPSLVLTFYALFIFAFPEETGERMGLAMDCFLTISILMMMVSDMMPIDSNVTPLLGAFMLVSMLSITFSIFMNAVCFNMHRSVAVPNWLHHIIFNRILPLTVFKSCLNSIRKSGNCSKYACCEGVFAASIRRKQSSTTRYFEEMDRLEELKKYAAKFTPAHAYEANTVLDTNSLDEEFVETYEFIQMYFPKPLSNDEAVGGNDGNPPTDAPSFKSQNERDKENVETLLENVYGEEESEYILDFWRCVAQTTDRVCLIFVSVLYASISIGLMYQVPSVSFT